MSRSTSLCQFPAAARVNVDVGPQLIAHVGGIARCASPHVCPMCTPIIRERRALEIDLACDIALARGLGVEFVTITCPHKLGDPLADRLSSLTSALQQILSGAPWKRRKGALSYLGAIRAFEVTYGANGWHPHVHALLFFEHPLTAAQRADLRAWMTGRWSGIVERKGYGTLHARHGVDVRQVVDADDVGHYLTKVDGGWNPARELARSDRKKSGKGMSPWQMLEWIHDTGDTAMIPRWQEYESATFGRRAIVWSPGLRHELLGQEDAPSDSELAASEGADLATLVRFLVAPSVWRQHLAAGSNGDFLSRCEDQAAAIIEAQGLTPGVEPWVVTVEASS